MYYNKDINKVKELLKTSDSGLTAREAYARNNLYGRNVS